MELVAMTALAIAQARDNAVRGAAALREWVQPAYPAEARRQDVRVSVPINFTPTTE
jgi:hypothetical protein